MKQIKKLPDWAEFVIKTILYTGIIFVLIYLFVYNNVESGSFIYNDF